MSDVPYPESEAEAAVGEARALEAETRAERAERVHPERFDRPVADPEFDYRRLNEVAAALVEMSYRVQNPITANPYAPLGAQIIGPAQAILADIRAYRPRAPNEPLPPAPPSAPPTLPTPPTPKV